MDGPLPLQCLRFRHAAYRLVKPLAKAGLGVREALASSVPKKVAVEYPISVFTQ